MVKYYYFSYILILLFATAVFGLNDLLAEFDQLSKADKVLKCN